ncbi:MAG TPA: permease [Desulfomonilia bacterium]
MNKELKILLYLIAAFAIIFFLPVDSLRFQGAVIEAFRLLRWYAREHVLLCLVPAFFIAGAIGVFISQASVMKYFGPTAKKWLSYSVASVSGTVLAVCSCTVLPLFGGIYMRGAGLGPAIAFLYSGPAINVLAIVLTARVIGWEMGLARAIGAVLFSIVIGLLMHFIFIKEERAKVQAAGEVYYGDDIENERPLWQTVLFFFSMIGILVFANWGRPVETTGIWHAIFSAKWVVTALFGIMFAAVLWRFFKVKFLYLLIGAVATAAMTFVMPGMPSMAVTAGVIALSIITFYSGSEMTDWREQTWGFAKQITPLLFGGVLVAGFLLGSPESKDAGIIPSIWIQAFVGNTPEAFMSLTGMIGEAPAWLNLIWPVWTNFFASLSGALMYFATLTEVPIVRGLIDSGMGQGPALALLLAGPALSLPSMLVINSVIGPRKTLVYIILVVIMATISGMVYGAIV